MNATRSFAGTRPFAIFLVTGGIAALINIGSRIGYSVFAPYTVAIVFAHVTGMIAAFALARVFVFERSARPVAHQFARFALVNVASLAQVLLVSLALADLLFPLAGFGWHAETVAHAVGVTSTAFTSYLLHRGFTFAK